MKELHPRAVRYTREKLLNSLFSNVKTLVFCLALAVMMTSVLPAMVLAADAPPLDGAMSYPNRDNAIPTYPAQDSGDATATTTTMDSTDNDGDGYGAFQDQCLTLELSDTFGDGWNGGVLYIYEDGVMVESGLPADASYSQQIENSFYIVSPQILF